MKAFFSRKSDQKPADTKPKAATPTPIDSTAPRSKTSAGQGTDDLVRKESLEKSKAVKLDASTSNLKDSFRNSSDGLDLKKRPTITQRDSDLKKGSTLKNTLIADSSLKQRPSTVHDSSRSDSQDSLLQRGNSLRQRPSQNSEAPNEALLTIRAKLEKQRKELATLSITDLNTPNLQKLSQEAHKLKNGSENQSHEDLGSTPSLQRRGSSTGDFSKAKSSQYKSNPNDNDVDIDPDEIEFKSSDRARTLWKIAIEYVKRNLANSKKNSVGTAMELVAETKKSIIDSNPIHEKVSINQGRADNHKAKIVEVLSRPVFYRSAEQLYALDLILKTFSGFSKFSKAFRMKLIEKSNYFEIGPHRVIIRQGGNPWAVYFLLSGKCLSETIIVHRNQGNIRRREIHAGEAFGEFGMVNDREKRTDTVFTLVNCILLSVPRDVYVELMKAEVMAVKEEKMQILRTISAFKTVSTGLLEKILNACHIFRYEAGASLLKVGDRERITIILEGQCRANRLIPFLVKQGDVQPLVNSEILGAYKPGSIPQANEQIVYHNLSIGVLGPGDYFPRVMLLRSEALEYRVQKVAIEKIVVLMNAILKQSKSGLVDKTNLAAVFNQELDQYAIDLEDSIAGIDLTVSAIDKVTCLVIHKMDLVNILSEETLLDLTNPEYEGLIGIGLSEIQQNYFEKIQWKGYRQGVVENVMQRRASMLATKPKI